MYRGQSDVNPCVHNCCGVRLLANQFCLDPVGRRAPRAVCEQQRLGFCARGYRNRHGLCDLGATDHTDLEVAHVYKEKSRSFVNVWRGSLVSCFDVDVLL